MRLPTDDHVIFTFARMTRRARTVDAKVDADPLATYAQMRDRLLVALRRARTPGPERDGLPIGTIGQGTRGHRTIDVPDDQGGNDAVPVTSVEAIALQDDEEVERALRDQLADDVQQALGYMHDMDAAAGALQTRLAAIDLRCSLLSRSENGGAGSCLACDTLVTGSANDRLKRGLGPCCYTTWKRHGMPDINVFRRTRKQQPQEAHAS